MASGRADKGFCRKKSKGEIKRRKRGNMMYLAITAIKKNPPYMFIMVCWLYLSAVFAFSIFEEWCLLLGSAQGRLPQGTNTLLHPRDAIVPHMETGSEYDSNGTWNNCRLETKACVCFPVKRYARQSNAPGKISILRSLEFNAPREERYSKCPFVKICQVELFAGRKGHKPSNIT